MSNKKELLSHSSLKDSTEESTETIDYKDKLNFGYAIKNGIFLGIVSYFALALIAIIVNFVLGTNVLVFYFEDLVFLIASSFFLFSGFIIWFGPSPQWALVKKSITKQNVKPISTSESLSIGLSRSITAIFLLVIISI